MSAGIRWYNRLAARLYPYLCEPLMELALPVWNAEAEADMLEWEESKERADQQRRIDEAYLAGAEQGYREGREDADTPW